MHNVGNSNMGVTRRVRQQNFTIYAQDWSSWLGPCSHGPLWPVNVIFVRDGQLDCIIFRPWVRSRVNLSIRLGSGLKIRVRISFVLCEFVFLFSFSLCLFVCLYVCLSLSLSLSLSLCLVCLYVCLSVCPFLFLRVFASETNKSNQIKWK